MEEREEVPGRRSTPIQPRMGGELLEEDHVVMFEALLRQRLQLLYASNPDECHSFTLLQAAEYIKVKEGSEDYGYFVAAFDKLLAAKFIVRKRVSGRVVSDDVGNPIFSINTRQKYNFGPWAPASK